MANYECDVPLHARLPYISGARGVEGVEATPGAGFGLGSTLLASMLPLLLVLRCGCVKGAVEVGRSMSTELCCAGSKLSPRGLMVGLAGP